MQSPRKASLEWHFPIAHARRVRDGFTGWWMRERAACCFVFRETEWSNCRRRLAPARWFARGYAPDDDGGGDGGGRGTPPQAGVAGDLSRSGPGTFYCRTRRRVGRNAISALSFSRYRSSAFYELTLRESSVSLCLVFPPGKLRAVCVYMSCGKFCERVGVVREMPITRGMFVCFSLFVFNTR